MTENLKIVIPMAGWGSRMRPHTWSKPKPLVSVAGKPALAHLLDMFSTLPDPANIGYVFIVGPCLGEQQIPPYIQANYPALQASYVVQNEMKGQSHALWLARETLRGPLLICFSDTLLETDFSFLKDESADGVAWVKPVPDPRRFGVAELAPNGWVKRFVEKPKSIRNNLVVVGCYYFKEAGQLLDAIEEQMRRGIQLNNEFFLTDAISLMIAAGAHIRTQPVDVWLDTGTLDATLGTNRYLLEHGRANKLINETYNGVEILAPVFIHATAQISNSVIGPFASIGPDCRITNARITDTILDSGVILDAVSLKDSLIGRQAHVQGRSANDPPMAMNIGDNSSVIL